MKKIVCLIDSLGHGGAQRQMVILASLLKDVGYDVKVAYYHDLTFYKPYLDEHRVENGLINGANNTRKRIGLVRKFLKMENPDVVIAYLDTPSIVACVCKLLGGRFKLIVSERNTTQRLTRSERIKFFLYRWADAIVPNSFSQERFISEHYHRLARKTTTITNCLDFNQFYPSESKLANQRPVLITVGRIAPQKNVKRYIEAVKILADRGIDFEVRWFGGHYGGYSDECVQLVKEKGLKDRFHFHAPDSNIGERYREADVFVLPSTYEGFPNVLCEAMACGLPCLASNICDNQDILANKQFLFNPENIGDIADKLEMLIALEESKKELIGEANAQFIKELCDPKQFVSKYINLIQLMSHGNWPYS